MKKILDCATLKYEKLSHGVTYNMFLFELDYSNLTALDIINIVSFSVLTILSLLTLYRIIFFIIGFFGVKRFKETDIRKKYAVVISARNESKTIGNLIDSIHKQDYPQELITIFVVADNCTDNTAEIAREHGAVVYERFNNELIGKGYALNLLFKNIEKDYGIQSFDAFIMFDADNLLKKDYITRMNEAHVHGYKILTSYRSVKNFDSNLISGMYGFHQYRNMRSLHVPRTYLNLSCTVTGTGFLFASETVKNGWDWLLITEDIEFSLDKIIEGYQIGYCHDAVFYDEQPTTVKMMFRQRTRWAKGYLMTFGSRTGQIIKKMFSRKKPNNKIKRFVYYDMFIQIFPYSLVVSFWRVLVLIATVIATILMKLDVEQFFINYGWNLLKNYGVIYLTLLLQVLPVLIVEWKRIPARNYKKIIYFFFFPIFDMINIIIMTIALFSKPAWKPIIHDDTRNIKHIEKFHK